MPWKPEDLGTDRSRDELLREVLLRGQARLRRQRALAAAAGTCAVALMLAGVGAALALGGGTPTEVAATGPRATSPSPIGPVATTAPEEAKPPPGAAGTHDGPATTSPPARPPARPPASQPSVSQPATAAPATTVPAFGPAEPKCTAEHLSATATPEKPTFGPGEEVVILTSLSNRSSVTCYYAGYERVLAVTDAQGAPAGPTLLMHVDGFVDTALAPGASIGEDRARWHPKICSPEGQCGFAPPGAYTGTLTWRFYGSEIVATAPFQVVA